MPVTCAFAYSWSDNTTGSTIHSAFCDSNSQWQTAYQCTRTTHKNYIILFASEIINMDISLIQPLLFTFFFINLANPNYCKTINVPTLTNANTTAPDQRINALTYFNCSMGYISSEYPTPPYFSCLAYNITDGQWSTVTSSCDRKFKCEIFFNCIVSLALINRLIQQSCAHSFN